MIVVVVVDVVVAVVVVVVVAVVSGLLRRAMSLSHQVLNFFFLFLHIWHSQNICHLHTFFQIKFC